MSDNVVLNDATSFPTLDSILEIANGAVEAVGQKFEKILHRGMPVVIGFLADQVGLGGVGQKLRELIDGLRAKVDEAILWLIDMIKAGLEALVGAVKAGAAKLLEWWKARSPVQMAGGEEHQLYFAGTEQTAELTIESTPVPLEKFLSDYEASQKPVNDQDKAVIKQIRTQVTLIQKEKATTSYGKGAGLNIQAMFVKVVALLEQLSGSTSPPKTSVEWKTKGDEGRSMVAAVLCLNPGKYAGSQPSYESALWSKVRRRVLNSSGDPVYVRGHLLNHHLHGPGDRDNLVPITKRANSQMERFVESQLKNAILGERRVFRYEVWAVFGSPPAGELAVCSDGSTPEKGVPNELELKASELTADGKKDKKNGLQIAKKIDIVLPKNSDTKVVG